MSVLLRPVSCLVLGAIWFGTSAPTAADEVLRWNEATLNAIRAERTSPPIAARNLAMVHIAIDDAVNAIVPTHEPYHARPQAAPGASPEAAAAAAAHRVLTTVHPQQRGPADALLQAALGAIPEGPAKSEGVRVGLEAADAIIQLRQGDIQAGQASGALPAPTVGVWRPTSPGMQPLLPSWGRIRPFTLRSNDQFRQKGPPKPQTGNYANSFERVKAYGGRNSTVRTPEQTQIAHFWSDGAGTATPPGHWNMIAQDVSRRQGLDLPTSARVFALLNLALADAAIVAWDMKFTYMEWRPITGIRNAADDNNNRTEPDPAWEPLLDTPPFPDYVSGHSTFSNAGAEMLALVFGNDRIAFTTTTDALPGVQRSFSSFSEAAEEAGESRIFGGIHWGHADKDGSKAGRQLARYVYQHHLTARGGGQGRGVQAPGGPPSPDLQAPGQGRGNAPGKAQGKAQGKGQGRGRPFP